jgi:hypothetical protein
MEDGFISPERGAHADYDAAADALREVEKALEAELARWARELKTGALKFWHPAAGKEPYQIEVHPLQEISQPSRAAGRPVPIQKGSGS